jgi:hypothetical protein
MLGFTRRLNCGSGVPVEDYLLKYLVLVGVVFLPCHDGLMSDGPKELEEKRKSAAFMMLMDRSEISAGADTTGSRRQRKGGGRMIAANHAVDRIVYYSL